MNNVLITTSSFDDRHFETLAKAGLQAILNPLARKLTERELSDLLQKHRPVGLIAGVEPITREVLEQASFLKGISRCGIGLDSVDLAAASDCDIKVTNTPDAPTIPVAELTVGMMLTLLRSIHLADFSVRQGGWERPMGTLLHGKTVGILGCGRIGSYVAKLVAAFGAVPVGYDPNLPSHPGLPLVPLEELLGSADLVTLHLPYSEQTHHILNRERLGQMKETAFLVNASRGGLVDEAALSDFLLGGKLAGAALDCFENEPYAGPLAGVRNTLLTGHIGSYAKEGRAIMEQQAVANLLQMLAPETR